MMKFFKNAYLLFSCGGFFFFFLLCLSGVSYLVDFELFSTQVFSIHFPLLFDWMGMSVVVLVSLICYCVFGFSLCYLGSEDKKLFLLISSFVFGMWLICLVPTLAGLMLGWDILGMVSYKLIIYYPSDKSLSAGNFTVFVNRFGDVALVLAVGLIFCSGSSLWLQDLESPLILSLIFISAMTKSASYPFMAWLPEAMAAPTPVSALVHSSTLVTAGVLLLSRFSAWGKLNESILFYLGMYVCFLSGVTALFEWDVKKVVALSTLSQLGIMFIALGVGMPVLAFFHLCTHACFKALLFICVGVLIKYRHHCQDLRFMAYCFKHSFFTTVSMVVACFALCGLPCMAGFFSKDMIYEKLVGDNLGIWSFVFLYASFGLTSAYSLKLFNTLFMKHDFFVLSAATKYEPRVEMGVLGIMSVFVGSLFFHLLMKDLSEVYLSSTFKFMGAGAWVMGLVMFLVLNKYKSVSNSFFGSLGYLSKVSTQPLMVIFLYFSEVVTKVVDLGVVEKMVGQGQLYNLKKFFFFFFSWQSKEWSKSFFSFGRVFFLLGLFMMLFVF